MAIGATTANPAAGALVAGVAGAVIGAVTTGSGLKLGKPIWRWRDLPARMAAGQARGEVIMRRASMAAVLLELIALGGTGCAGDPAEFGITGPFPKGTPPVTLTPQPNEGEISDDTPGIHADALDRYAPSNELGQTAPSRPRYFGYDR